MTMLSVIGKGGWECCLCFVSRMKSSTLLIIAEKAELSVEFSPIVSAPDLLRCPTVASLVCTIALVKLKTRFFDKKLITHHRITIHHCAWQTREDQLTGVVPAAYDSSLRGHEGKKLLPGPSPCWS